MAAMNRKTRTGAGVGLDLSNPLLRIRADNGRLGYTSLSSGALCSGYTGLSGYKSQGVNLSNSMLSGAEPTTPRQNADLRSSLLTSGSLKAECSSYKLRSNPLLSREATSMASSSLSSKPAQVTKLTSALTLTSCHLGSRPTCMTNMKTSGVSNPLSSSLSLLPTKLTHGLANLTMISGMLGARSGENQVLKPGSEHKKTERVLKSTKRKHEVSSDTDQVLKKIKYNIDWNLVKVFGEEEEVKMELSSPVEVAERQAKPEDAVTDVKKRFMNAISASLLRAPNFRAVDDKTRIAFVTMCEEIANLDPEFILKVAIYNRKDLNIRGASSFLLAFAAHSERCRPYLKKYFKDTIVLPSDWIEVAEIYQTFQDKKINFGALPNALRKVMTEKFADFDKYQLGKYNKEKKSKVRKKPSKKEQDRIEKQTLSGITPAEPVSDEDSDGDESTVELKTFTLKQLIRQLHISTPADHVMALVGKKYPETREDFYRFKLPGEFDERLVGKRMKLPIPETWETQVSMRGNKAEVWQSLIDHKKLPFMAMLRNIRNMLKAGISEKHHQWVIGKLTDEGAIANSKQFPFRFFSAYTVLNQLEEDYNKHQTKLVEIAEKLEDADTREMESGPANKKKTKDQRRRNQKKTEMRKQLKRDLRYDVQLVERYRKALDASVQLATNYNVPPIPGVTLILCNVGSSMFKPCLTYKGMGQPRQVVEVGVLLGLMCKHSCESSELVIYMDGNKHNKVSLSKRGILANTESLVNFASTTNISGTEAAIPKQLLSDILLERRHVDNIIVLSDGLRYDRPDGEKMEEFLHVYRHLVNPRVLFVSIDLSSNSTGVDAGLVSKHPNDVFLAGFSDQLLRFVAQRGDSGQRTYVENIDAKYNLTAKGSGKDAKISSQTAAAPKTRANAALGLPLPLTKTLTWRVARVFISSTFLDMHGERDMLTRFVFPEIRQWARKRLVNVLDVDLRWGVSQHATKESGSLSLCLSEVLQADYFVGILGGRAGWKPELGEIPYGEQFDWMRNLPQPQSATALEIQLALRTKALDRCFFFIRDDTNLIFEVPFEHQDLFTEYDAGAALLRRLRETVRTCGAQVFDQYPAIWGGVVDGKPMTAGLEQFALRAMRMVKTAIMRDYPLDEVYADELEEIRIWQDSLVEAGCEKFKGRSGSFKEFNRAYNNFGSGICLVHGDFGVGKSTFMCRVSHELLQTDEPTFRHIVCTGYSNMTTILRRLCQEISTTYHLPYNPVYDYFELISVLEELLIDVSAVMDKPYVIMIDGLNYVDPENNAHCGNWLPETIPKNIVFLLSCTSGSDTHRVLARRQDVSELELKALELLDKSVIVKETLANHGKALDDSPFNNQMKLLTGKKSANNPLYLMLACEQLRFHGVFEKVSEKIRQMPQTLPKLLEYIMASMEVDFGVDLISKLMKLFYCLPTGATINDMKVMLSVYLGYKGNNLAVSQSMFSMLLPDHLIPALTFTQILHRLNTLLDDYQVTGILRLSYGSVKEAIKKRYVKAADSEQHCHALISGYYLQLIESLQPEPHNIRYYTDIVYHLKCCGQFGKVKQLLTDLQFLHSKCSLGLVTSLNADYSPSLPAKAGSMAERKWMNTLSEMIEYSQFIYKSTHLLLRSPNQLVQFALNESDASVINQSAHSIVDTLGIDYIDWVTKPNAASKCVATIQGSTVVNCTAVSPDGELLAVGGEDCRVRLYLLSSCEEVTTLVGHAHLISDICFVAGNRLMSASHDNTVSLWDISTGNRLSVMSKHSRRVSSCAATKLSLLTAGWDGLVKMWTRDGKLKNDVCRVPSPINDMSIHPDEVYAAIACWDSSIKIYDILTNKRLSVLHGHKSSVRSVSYSNTGRYISSVALDGEVKLWSAFNGSQMGSFEGHSLPVRDLCFSSDGDRLITAAEDCRVKVWSGQLGLCEDMWTGVTQSDSVSCVAINNAGKLLVAGTSLGSIHCFEIDDLAEPLHSRQLEEHTSLTSICFGTDGCSVLCSTSTGSLYKWDTSNVDEFVLWEKGNSTAAILSVDSSPQWIVAFTNDKGSVTVRSYDGQSRCTDMKRHSGAVMACSFSHTGDLLATGGADSNIVIWEVKSEAALTLTPVTTIPQAHLDWVTSLNWSDCVNQLASGSNDCLIKLWDFSKSTPSTTAKVSMTGHAAAVTSIAYKAGCLVSASMDGVLKVWSQKGSEVTSIKSKSGSLNTCALTIRLTPTTDYEDDHVEDWGTYMDIDDAAPTKVTKAKIRADMVKNVRVVVGTGNGQVQLWNPLQANETEQFITTSAALSVCSHGDRVISSHLDKSIRVWSLPYDVEVQANDEHAVGQRSDHHQVTAIARLGLHHLVSGSLDGHVTLWDVSKSVPVKMHSLLCSSSAISTITANVDDNPLILDVGVEDGMIYTIHITPHGDLFKMKISDTWRLGQESAWESNQALPTGPVLHIDRVSINSKKRSVVYGDHTGFITSFLARNGTHKEYKNSLGSSYGLRLSVDDNSEFESRLREEKLLGGTYLLPGDVVTCHTVSQGQKWIGTDKGEIRRLGDGPWAKRRGHEGRVTSLVLDHRLLISGSEDSTVKIWEANQFGNLKLMSNFNCPAPVTNIASEFTETVNHCYNLTLYIGDKLGTVHRLDFHHNNIEE